MSETPTEKFLREAFGPKEEVTSENDAESRGVRNTKKATALFKNLDNEEMQSSVDSYIFDFAKAYRGEGRSTTSGSAGEILTRLSAMTGADFNEVIDPKNNPANVIREAYRSLNTKTNSV